jgi:hypothetical protein
MHSTGDGNIEIVFFTQRQKNLLIWKQSEQQQKERLLSNQKK